MGIEAKINYQLNKCPAVKKIVKRAYQKVMYMLSSKIKLEGNIMRVSPDDPEHEYFFGYYDKSPWDETDRYMLCMRARDTWSDVSPREKAEIILIDTYKNNRISKLGETSSWNVQQGCMLQWVGPEYRNRVLYNDCRDGQYCSVILKLSYTEDGVDTTEEKIIPAPVYSVAADGSFALTLDFSRLYRLRPGYGYYNVPEATANEKLPDKPCIWRVDLTTGEVKPILRYTDFAYFEPRSEMQGAEHKVNHIMLSPDGKRFMVLHRWFQGQRKYTRLVTCNMDGTDMYNLSDDDMVSHCCWRNNRQILAFENKRQGTNGGKSGNGYYLMKDKTQEFRRLWPDIDYDGHPSYSPDGGKIVFDRYPDRSRMAAIMVSDAKNRKDSKVNVIARMFAPFKYDNDTRCDLHPRWNRAGTQICFDSVFEGHRGLYTAIVLEKDKKINEKPLISVIVPVYSVEKYLRRCVESITTQTYSNLQIILVDDGSPDCSGMICDELANEDERIQVIHKENGGLSSARNVGVKAAVGEYIAFVDSDDWIHPNCYEYLLWLIQSYTADASQINFELATEYTLNAKNEKENICVHFNKKILQNYMTSTTTTTGNYCVWRCLFKRKLVAGIMFREGKINEDIDYKYKALQKCHTFVESNQKLYFYFQSTGSISTSGLRGRDYDLYEAAEELHKLTQNEQYGTIRFLGEVKKARTPFSLLCRIAYYGIADAQINKKEAVRRLTKEHRKNVWILLKAPIGSSRKVIAILLYISEPLTEWMIHLFKKIERLV